MDDFLLIPTGTQQINAFDEIFHIIAKLIRDVIDLVKMEF